MKKLLFATALTFAAVLPLQQAQGWYNSKVSAGFNWHFQSGGNCYGYGLIRDGQPYGPDFGASLVHTPAYPQLPPNCPPPAPNCPPTVYHHVYPQAAAPNAAPTYNHPPVTAPYATTPPAPPAEIAPPTSPMPPAAVPPAAPYHHHAAPYNPATATGYSRSLYAQPRYAPTNIRR